MRIQGSAADLELAGLESPPAGELVVGLDADGDVVFTADGPPWPVRDELFALPPGEGALVVDWPEVADGLAAADHAVVPVDRLTVAALAEASVVVLPPRGDALPVHAMAVLAARRVLVTGPVETTFGLFPGIDFLHAAAADAAVELTGIALLFPASTVTLRALGAVAAERHRASRVYERLTATPY
jgi:hypothetical protein